MVEEISQNTNKMHRKEKAQRQTITIYEGSFTSVSKACVCACRSADPITLFCFVIIVVLKIFFQ